MFFKRIFKALFGKEEERVVERIDSESVRSGDINKALLMQKTARDAQLAQLLAERKERQEENKTEDKEQELIKKLKQQEKEIKEKNIGKSFSMRKFFNAIGTIKKPSKFGKEIEITDKNDEEVLGKFGDIAIFEGGALAMLDVYGNPIAIGRELSHIISKPDSIHNQIKRKKLSIPYILDSGKNLSYVPDLENLEYPDMSYNQRDDIYELTEERTDKVKNILINKNNEIRKHKKTIERLEKINIDIKSELDDITRSLKLSENQADNSQTHLSKVLDRSIQFETKVGDLQRQITSLTELKALNETIIVRQENIIENLLNKAEALGVKSHFERELGTVLDLIDELRDKLPNTVINEIKQEPKAEPPIQPGQPLKR